MVYVIGVGFIVMVLAFGSHVTKTDISTAFGPKVNIGTMVVKTKNEQ